MYGYALLPSTQKRRDLAWRLQHEIDIQPLADTDDQITISGGVVQSNIGPMEAFRQQLEVELQRTIRTDLQALLGFDSQRFHFVVAKLLVAPPGAGEQVIHFDSTDGPGTENKLSILVYCSSAHSTAMPRFPPSVLQQAVTTEEMQSVSHFMHERWFHRVAVHAGDLMVFWQSTPHFGSRNAALSQRVVFFTMLSLLKDPSQDQYQMFHWIWMGEAYGWHSKEYALSLIRYRKHEPLLRFSGESEEDAVKLLKKFNVWGLYNRRKIEADEVEVELAKQLIDAAEAKSSASRKNANQK